MTLWINQFNIKQSEEDDHSEQVVSTERQSIMGGVVLHQDKVKQCFRNWDNPSPLLDDITAPCDRAARVAVAIQHVWLILDQISTTISILITFTLHH